ncbi:hypothetical protein GCM10010423_02820 [Streptomyces levis]|uniref:Uncharacterized protein n=1 Tax=Streptomyces levis TaxID=285566 RepID=A0ABN3N6N4_9ACTN
MGAGTSQGAPEVFRRELPPRTCGNAEQRETREARSPGAGGGFGGRCAVQLVGVRRRKGVRQMRHAPPRHSARRYEERMRRGQEGEVVQLACRSGRRAGQEGSSTP